jgi:SSS family solute:Na+ symporter
MIDLIIVLLYIFLLVLVSIYFRSKSNKFSDYIKIGKKFSSSKMIFVVAIFTTSVGGGTTFGLPEKIYQGKLYYPIALIIVIFADLFIAKYLIKRLKSFSFETIGDILFKHYGKIGKFIGGISTILISIGYMTVQMSVATYIFEFFFKIGHISSMIISYGMIIFFNLIGGVRSIFANHVLQFIAVIIAIPIIFFLGIKYIGSSHIISYIQSDHIKLSLDRNLILTIFTFTIMTFHPSLIQRVAVSKDIDTEINPIYIKSAIYAILIILISFNGIFAIILEKDIVAWQALPYMINKIIPTGFKGFVIIGLLASVISTADSELNISSISLIKDIFINLFKISNNNLMFILSRLFTFIFAAVGIITSLYFDNIIDLVIFSAGFWAPIILVSSIFALYNISVNMFFFVSSSIGGLLSFLIWQVVFFNEYKINSIIIGFSVSLLIFISGLIYKQIRRPRDIFNQ